ncbi:hypothetical protein D3C85_1634110 [compost metagenome]
MVTLATTSIGISTADETVTLAPTGLRSSTASRTFSIMGDFGARLSSDRRASFTVPFPFQTGNTFTSPTPGTSSAHCR